MKDKSEVAVGQWSGSCAAGTRREIERTNARLRHFRGVAVSVLNDALKLWGEIWEAVQDTRSCEEILNGSEGPQPESPQEARAMLVEKLHLLGIHMDYARRLCEGSIGEESQEEREDWT